MNLCIPFHTCAFNTPIPYLCVDCSFSCNPALYLGCCLTESQADFSDFHFPGAHAVSDLRFLLQVFLRCFFYMFCCSACLSRLMGKTSNHGLSPWLTLNFHWGVPECSPAHWLSGYQQCLALSTGCSHALPSGLTTTHTCLALFDESLFSEYAWLLPCMRKCHWSNLESLHHDQAQIPWESLWIRCKIAGSWSNSHWPKGAGLQVPRHMICRVHKILQHH